MFLSIGAIALVILLVGLFSSTSDSNSINSIEPYDTDDVHNDGLFRSSLFDDEFEDTKSIFSDDDFINDSLNDSWS